MDVLKEEKKNRRKGFKVIACIDEAGRGCEKPDAKILTNNGWKFYDGINFEKDKVLSYTNKGYIEWQKIGKIIEKKFKGSLIELKNRGIKIVVTPDHYFTIIRRVFKRDKQDNNRLKLVGYKTRKERKLATGLLDNDFIPRGGKWRGANKNFFKLSKISKNEDRLIDIKLWVAFLGIFLSEGSISYDKKKCSYRIVVSQSEKAPRGRYEEIYRLLKKLPFKFTKIKTGFRCYNKHLYIYLKQFGNCYSKFIPKDVKELNPQLLNILIKWMILGDGTCYTGKNRKGVCIYYTVSKKLKDDFEEVLLKAGWTYHTSVRAPKERYINDRMIRKENQVPCFEIRLRRNNKAQVRSLHKKKISYKGKVFCLQLPRYHNFYVRRNGTGYFTGNSLAGPVVTAVAVTEPGSKKLGTILKNINDSKKISFKKREEVYDLLVNCPQIEWATSRVSEKVIDRINILEATKLAMERAVKNLNRKLGKIDFLIIDGNFGISLDIPQKSIIKADEKVFSVMAASIIAKVTRDRMMLRYHQRYPNYQFASHKGYPTKLHRRLLKKNGPCKIHRRTFRPVRCLIKKPSDKS